MRYRGYYYDTGTNLYYLQSRYYDANIGRFINSDEAVNVIYDMHNLFTYCANNPINMIDINGYRSYSVSKVIRSSYSKKSYKKYNNYYIIPLTYYMETKNGGTITWSSNKSFTTSFTLSTSFNAKYVASQIGVTYQNTLHYSQSYSFKVNKKKGKYARIVAKIPAKAYRVYLSNYYKCTYYKTVLFFTYVTKTIYYTRTSQIGFVFVPLINKMSISLQYSNKK